MIAGDDICMLLRREVNFICVSLIYHMPSETKKFEVLKCWSMAGNGSGSGSWRKFL